MRKKTSKKQAKKKNISSNKMMFLSIVLLFIIFEALYALKASIQPHSVQQVAGVHTEK
jgi:hypothetical protein